MSTTRGNNDMPMTPSTAITRTSLNMASHSLSSAVLRLLGTEQKVPHGPGDARGGTSCEAYDEAPGRTSWNRYRSEWATKESADE